ncbi:1-acyl-sn-glycerol-3-phosphate acyltransferase [Nitzschia inconspicua]|uniref:1-acyl-sn-glycerol-3-phosphate acyltransferase n=1 Tax=Nitzschia inconspicua TaxID=303405 RepID=A0A9K3LFC3_9STRA|nr:1-acyl-sn-glycerol-3-phosphate acyltransferase [Nitzschia inconspicua]
MSATSTETEQVPKQIQKEEPTAATTTKSTTTVVTKKKKTYQELRAEGGPFTFNTPIGALNPFALYYGITSIVLGIPWFISCKLCQLLYFITGNRFDKKRRIPVFLSHVWGVTLMRLTRCYPTIKNLDILQDFYKENRPAMFVANHCSWMDIPFLGASIGWRNYKLISKKELGVVPILGTAIRAGGHIMVDRTDRRSQLATLKQGINYLKDGVHLCTFPEGTRSRDGRMLKFKNGAFKMAYKAGAPIIPISIINSHKVMPTGWMMAMRPAHGLAEVVVHEPVESEGKTEEELAQAVRQSMINGLPEDQVPL